MSEDTIGIVIDNGSKWSKAGFSGESFPRCVIPTAVGRFRHTGLLDGVKDFYFGKDATKNRGICNLNWPVKGGTVLNWTDMENLWHHIFYRELHVAPEQCKIMIAIHPLATKKEKETIAEIMLETFTVKALYLVSSPALVLTATGRTTGVVWECGDSCSYITPVFEGFPLKNATVTSAVNGKVLTEYFQKLLSVVGYSFTTPAEIDVIEKAKIDLCYVTGNHEEELKEALFNKERIQYKLPDGQYILVGEEKFKCPELLFTPELQESKYTNIADDIYYSLTQCDMDYKSTFYSNIVLSGGGTMFEGLPSRLQMELNKKVHMSPETRVAVEAPTSRNVLPWIGGSILSSMEAGGGFLLSRDEYNNMAFENPAIVIDNGSYMIKAGFACDNHPISMFRTLVGRPEKIHEYKTAYYDVYVGDEVVDRIDDLVLNKPVVRSLTVDWDDMERVWHHIFYKELRVAPEDRAVIMGVASKSSMEERIQCFETLFETLNAPALCIQSQSVLGMYGSGLTTGICVDMGHDTTDVVPVYEGRTIKYAQIETGVAGRQISDYMRRCLHDCCDLKSATDMEVLKRTCYVTKDCAMPIRDYTRKYKLPSGKEIDVSNECFMAAEMIFQPDLVIGEETGYIPLHVAVVTAVSKCDSELHPQLYDAIVLCGGLAMVTGTAKRLHCEIGNKANEHIQIHQSPECYATPWLGGAVFASLDGAKDMWIEKEQYEEHGHRIIKNKMTF